MRPSMASFSHVYFPTKIVGLKRWHSHNILAGNGNMPLNIPELPKPQTLSKPLYLQLTGAFPSILSAFPKLCHVSIWKSCSWTAPHQLAYTISCHWATHFRRSKYAWHLPWEPEGILSIAKYKGLVMIYSSSGCQPIILQQVWYFNCPIMTWLKKQQVVICEK